MPKENKSNDTQFQERVFTVMEMLLAGQKPRQIFRNVSENEELKWRVSERQIENYIKLANREILKLMDKNKLKLKKKAFARYDFLYQKMVDAADFKGALSAVEKQAILTGVIEPNKIAAELTSKTGEQFKITLNLNQ